ncbi:7419_t:CDS:2, partial [Gigaspora rosea]
LDISFLHDKAKKLQLKAKYENKLEKDSSEHDSLRFLRFYSIAALQVFWFVNVL